MLGFAFLIFTFIAQFLHEVFFFFTLISLDKMCPHSLYFIERVSKISTVVTVGHNIKETSDSFITIFQFLFFICLC